MNNKEMAQIPFFLHEATTARLAEANRRLLIALIVLAAATIIRQFSK